jgi:hypothetical protein
MDHESCNVDRGSIASNDVAFFVDVNHIAGFKVAEMVAQWIDPKGVWVDRISDAYMSTRSLCVAFAGEDSKRASHMLELPLPLVQ